MSIPGIPLHLERTLTRSKFFFAMADHIFINILVNENRLNGVEAHL